MEAIGEIYYDTIMKGQTTTTYSFQLSHVFSSQERLTERQSTAHKILHFGSSIDLQHFVMSMKKNILVLQRQTTNYLLDVRLKSTCF